MRPLSTPARKFWKHRTKSFLRTNIATSIKCLVIRYSIIIKCTLEHSQQMWYNCYDAILATKIQATTKVLYLNILKKKKKNNEAIGGWLSSLTTYCNYKLIIKTNILLLLSSFP